MSKQQFYSNYMFRVRGTLAECPDDACKQVAALLKKYDASDVRVCHPSKVANHLYNSHGIYVTFVRHETIGVSIIAVARTQGALDYHQRMR